MQRRTELAGGEVVEGAKASGEFCGVQVALAVEAAEKIIGRLFSFLGIAFYAARDQVAVGISGPVLDAIQLFRANLLGRPHLHHVPRFAALNQTQSALGHESAHRTAHRSRG